MGNVQSDKKNKILALLWTACIILLSCLCLFLVLQETQTFVYYYREQQQIFMFDSDYIFRLLKPIGGFAVMVSQWLVQFFVLPNIGAFTSTLLSLLSAIFLLLIMQRLNPHCAWLTPLAILPAFLYNICLQEYFVHYEGLVALVMATIVLWIYTLLPKEHWAWRLCIGSLLTLVLFYLAGSVAVLVSLTMLIIDLLRRVPKSYLSLLPLALVLLAGLIAVHEGWIVSHDLAFWTKGYCEYYYEPTMLHTLAWLSLPLLLFITWLAARWKSKNSWLQPSLSVVLLAVVLLCCRHLAISATNPAYYSFQKQMHYANVEDWQKLTEITDINPTNEGQMNYLNLALSQQGRLLDNLLSYPQQGINSLILNDVQYTEMTVLMSRIYYHVGVIGAAQYLAFCSTVGNTYSNPSMMKLLVKTNLINGTYSIAEKYISFLEKSWYYADWASEQRKFLHNDDAVMADPELGEKRRSLPDDDSFVMINGPMKDLQAVLDANPDNREAAEYLIAMLLLAKDYEGILWFVEHYHGKGYLTTLPQLLQEAIVAILEQAQDPDYCRSLGVSEETLYRFAQFRRLVLDMRRSGLDNRAKLMREYDRTYWYYLLK